MGLTERVDDRLVPASRPSGAGDHRLGPCRPDRGQRLHRRLRRWLGCRADGGAGRGASDPIYRSGGATPQPERVLYLWCARAWGDPTLELGGCSLCPTQPHRDPYAAGSAFPVWNAPSRHLGSIRRLVRPARSGFDSVGPDRGGGGSAASRARGDRAGGGTYGAPQRAVARTHRRTTLSCVRPPCSGDGSGHAREARNGLDGDSRGLCATQYSERWVRPNEISRWKEPGTLGLRSSIDPARLKRRSLENRRSYTYERGKGHTEWHRGRTSAETWNDTYGTECVHAPPGCWVGTRLDFSSGAHGRHCLTHHSSGAWRALLALAGTHLHRLACHRSLPCGGAQPGSQLAPAPTQTDQAPHRNRAHLPGSIGGAALCGGDLLARAGRPDKWADQIRHHRGQRTRGSDRIPQGA